MHNIDFHIAGECRFSVTYQSCQAINAFLKTQNLTVSALWMRNFFVNLTGVPLQQLSSMFTSVGLQTGAEDGDIKDLAHQEKPCLVVCKDGDLILVKYIGSSMVCFIDANENECFMSQKEFEKRWCHVWMTSLPTNFMAQPHYIPQARYILQTDYLPQSSYAPQSRMGSTRIPPFQCMCAAVAH